MRADATLADRNESVREAAHDWLQAGWIDRNALEAIAGLYPDDRARAGPAFRILFFVLTVGALACVLGIFFPRYHYQYSVAAFALISGTACAAITDYLINRRKRRQGGIEAAFAAVSVSCLIISIVAFVGETGRWDGQIGHFLELLVLAALTGAAAWIWGYWFFAMLSAGLLYAGLLNLYLGRLIWAALVLIIYFPMSESCYSVRWPPALRKSISAFLTVSLLALYASFNLYLVDNQFYNLYFDYVHRGGMIATPRWVAILFTALLPVVILLAGVLRRRRLFLNLGFILVVLSLITLRHYIHIAPLWVILLGGGALMLALAEGLRRYLDSGTSNERAGFTANLLTEDPEKRRVLEMVVSVAAVTPQQEPSGKEPQFNGGGGKFGGGGASSDF